MDIAAFHARWLGNEGGERANEDPFLIGLCDLIGVSRPDPAAGDPEKDAYVYEKPAVLLHAAGKPTIGKIDLYREGRFLLEVKQASNTTKVGRTRRGTNAWHAMMSDALGQTNRYVETLDAPPPFLLVVDIGHAIDLFASSDAPDGRHWQAATAPRAQPGPVERDAKNVPMRSFPAVVERCPDTGLFVGWVPGFAGAHSQGETLDELHRNLREVLELLLEDGDPKLTTELVGVYTVQVA